MHIDMTDKVSAIADNVRARCGKDVAELCEFFRRQAHIDMEHATDDEGRLRAQAVAVTLRDLADFFRDESASAVNSAIEQDRLAVSSQP
jgi:RIO-like serine/threonine protein kinase